MRRFRIGLFWKSCIALVPCAIATPVFAVPLEVAFGTRYTQFQYAASLNPPLRSTESLTFPSMLGQARLMFTDKTYIQAQYEKADQLSSTYLGSDLNTSASVTAQNTLGFEGMEAALYLALSQHLTLYGGYGTRKWDRFLNGNPGYSEIYSWTYQPIGAQLWLFRGNRVDLGIDVSKRQTSRGKIKVITSKTVTGGADSEMNLGSKIGYRVASPLVWRVGSWTISTTPFLEEIKFGQSEVVPNTTLAPTPGTGIKEPDSITKQFGLEALITMPL